MPDISWFLSISAVLLIILVRILIPKMMNANNSNLRFGIGVVLFLIYTVVMLLVFGFLNTIDVEGTNDVTDRIYFAQYAVGVLVVNLSALFCACLHFFSRQKRKLSESEKMKLKDL